MLLRIIDNPASENNEDGIRVVFENANGTDSFDTESYTSPVYNNFHKTLAWYFNDYLQSEYTSVGDSGVVEKLVKFGQSIGDELLGEDFQLMKSIEFIAEHGYENLQVQLESERIEFFTELWETLVLHESKYVLSAVVQGFTRRFTQQDFPTNYPELHYHLTAPAPSTDGVEKLLNQAPKIVEEEEVENHQPLRILYLVSRPEDYDLPFQSSNSTQVSLNAIAEGGAIEFDVKHKLDNEQFENSLADKIRPIHLFHYDGPVVLENGAAYIILEDIEGKATQLELGQLAKMLVTHRVGALSIDARVYLNNNKSVSAAEGLATIALAAHKNGLGNVLGLGQITNPWTSSQCFESVYAQIAKGFSLAQAVVEARKALQSIVETNMMTVSPLAFHPWSLLVHYSKQPVIYFDTPHVLDDPYATKTLEKFNAKLFGFRTEMLPPLLNQVGDGLVLEVIDQLNSSTKSAKKIVSLVGEAGSGKSQTAHVVSLYLAEKNRIDYSFYFDFRNNNYTADDMLEMIAPIFDTAVDKKEVIMEKLTQHHCCFVLDDVLPKDDLAETNASWQALNNILQQLLSDGHKVIVTGETLAYANEFSSIALTTSPMRLIEQKILASNCLRETELSDEQLSELGNKLGNTHGNTHSNTETWDEFLSCMKGNPWLIKKLVPQLASTDLNQLKTEMTHYNNTQSGAFSIEFFYEQQWNKLQPHWKKLLTLSSEVRGLLLEMLMIASDQAESFIPAKSLFGLLGDENAKFSEGLTLWESYGFVKRFPHGRMIDTRCLPFVETQIDSAPLNDNDQKRLELNFSQLICEGIRQLSQHVLKQPNPNISNNLLINRRHWVKHFEKLWFSGDYLGFMSVKSSFDQLLSQAKLTNESKDWAFDLLKRTPLTQVVEENDDKAQLSWLALASSVLEQTDVDIGDHLVEGAAHWQTWFNSQDKSIAEKQLPMFQQVATFLERFYLRQSNWKNCLMICDKTYAIYMQYEAWQRVIQSLKSLARYHFELGDKVQSLMFENKILNDIPYADAPPGFQTQQMVDVLLMRLAKADTQHAQTLLDQLRVTEGAEKLTDMLDGIQSDIYYQEEDYLAALPISCKIWVKALKANHPPQIEQLKSRLTELEQKLGLDNFNEHFEREVPEGTIKPREYAVTLH